METENITVQADFDHDLTNLPAETRILYSKRKTVRGLRVAAIFLAVAILLPVCFSNEGWAYFFGLFITVATLIIGSGVYKKYKNRQPQIVISELGITTASLPFCAWTDITDEDVVEISEGKTTGYYLVYNYPYGQAKHALSFLDTDWAELSAILKIYRDRNQQHSSAKIKS